MKNAKIALPEISFDYWANKNEYFLDTEFTQTVSIGLMHAKKGGLIDSILKDERVTTNSGLVELIAKRIKLHSELTAFSDQELLTIFDLIQGWGGKTGRSPYVKPSGAPARLNWHQFADTYRQALKICFDKDFNHIKMLETLNKIPYLGDSFATKHMFFWTEYGPRQEAVPIYDTRIKLLLCLNEKNAATFDEFIYVLKSAASEQKTSVALIERALFSFSQNYFPNNALIINLDKVKDFTDIDQAKELEQEYKNLNNLNSLK